MLGCGHALYVLSHELAREQNESCLRPILLIGKFAARPIWHPNAHPIWHSKAHPIWHPKAHPISHPKVHQPIVALTRQWHSHWQGARTAYNRRVNQTTLSLPDLNQLRAWAGELGFASLGVADIDLSQAQAGFAQWLTDGFHGELDYMVTRRALRFDPPQLLPGVVSAIMTTMAYAPNDAAWVETAWVNLADDERAFVSRYALGRDYHKVVRARLNMLADRIAQQTGPFIHRPFCDSAPVLEVELARKAGLGWRGKHTLLLNREQGSMFFIGTLYTSLTLPISSNAAADGEHCGQCQRCIDVCPTGAIVAPYRVDARRCISYLTIELKGTIPPEQRASIGNRIYGCDDCQLACPWNKFAQPAAVADFSPRQRLDQASLIELFAWTEEQFKERTAGSAIARIGYQHWLRNIAVALGNALAALDANAVTQKQRLLDALAMRRDEPSLIVREHVQWAMAQAAS